MAQVLRVDDTHSFITYTGGWESGGRPEEFFSTSKTGTPGATTGALITFIGDGIGVYGTFIKGERHASTFFLDEYDPVSLSVPSPTATSFSNVFFERHNLTAHKDPHTPHILRIGIMSPPDDPDRDQWHLRLDEIRIYSINTTNGPFAAILPTATKGNPVAVKAVAGVFGALGGLVFLILLYVFGRRRWRKWSEERELRSYERKLAKMSEEKGSGIFTRWGWRQKFNWNKTPDPYAV